MSSPATAPEFAWRVPRDLPGWVQLFDVATLPILGSTAMAMEDLRAAEDRVDAHTLAEALSPDPLMTLKVLSFVGGLRRDRERGEPETLTAALVMLGVTPFFRAFGPQPTVEQHLAGRPEALAGFRAVLKRSRRAADFAVAFAVHRLDQDVTVIHEAVLLHAFAEMVLWLRAPHLPLHIAHMQTEDPTLRSSQAQKEVLHVQLDELQQALMSVWCLPALLRTITNPKLQRASAQVRNVLLAIRVARHSTLGWDNPALPDDVAEIAELLQLRVEPTWKLLLEFDT